MSVIIITAATLISYLQAWSYTNNVDLSLFRIFLLVIILLLGTIHFYFDTKNKKQNFILTERISWLVFFFLITLVSINAQKFYLLVPFVLSFILASVPIEKMIEQMLLVYSVFFVATVLASIFTSYATKGLWGFYHPNVASGYLVGIQMLLLLYSVYDNGTKIYLSPLMLIIPFLNVLTASSAGTIVSLMLSLLFFTKRKFQIYRRPVILFVFSLLPAILNYIVILIYRTNSGGIGDVLNTALSSRPYIWSKATETFSYSLFPTREKILFFDNFGNGYSMPIDSVYVEIPLTCGLLFSFLFMFIFFRFVTIGKNLTLSQGKEKLNTLLLCTLLMLLYGVIESHAIEYQVNPLLIVMIVCIYRKYSLKQNNFLW